MIPHVNESKDNFEDIDLQYAKDQASRVKWYHQLLLNRPLKVALALIAVAIATPLLIYQLAFFSSMRVQSADGFSFGSCLVPRASRIPCGLGDVSEAECHQQCCYDFANNMCYHRFPSRFSYIMDKPWTEDVLLRPRVSTVPFQSQSSLTNIRLSLDEVSPSHLSLTFYNSALYSFTGRRIDDKNYDVEVSSPELNVIVNSKGRTIFNTARGPLIASENIWEIAFKLTDESMYGFGEIPIKGNTVKVIYNHRGETTVPLIFAKTNGTYHGLLIDTVNPTEVSFHEDNVVLIRSITNFGLKFHVFVGPKPSDVMKDVRKLIGAQNDLQYWMLGAHVCSEHVDTQKGTAELNKFIEGAVTHNLPFESHCVTPIVLDGTCESEPVAFVDEGAGILHAAGKRFVPHVSPYIRYEPNEIEKENQTEVRNDVCKSPVQGFEDYMLLDSEGTGPYIGLIGNYTVIYPDYENIAQELMEKLWDYSESVDAVVLENSWPLDEAKKLVNETRLHLPYFSQHFEAASIHTPKWDVTNSYGEKHLYRHNEYGTRFASAFDELKPVPSWLSSHGMYGKAFWYRQEIPTSWQSLRNELIEAALGGVSGQWLWSTPICGDTENFDSTTHLNLCVKWYMAATYLPMIRIHSKLAPRDPLSFEGTHRTLMINALKARMSLAPYFYTTLQEGPLLRPMFYQFPNSEALKDLTSQFSVGDELVIVPNLQPYQAMVHMWIPPGDWYELWSGYKLEGEEGEAVTMGTTEFDFFTAIRAGSIIVLQKTVKIIIKPLPNSGTNQDVTLSAEATRSTSDISLTVALDCNLKEPFPGETCRAEGVYYISENIKINLFANDRQLISQGENNSKCDENLDLHIIEVNIYGLNDTVNNYDHSRHIDLEIGLCELITGASIDFI